VPEKTVIPPMRLAEQIPRHNAPFAILSLHLKTGWEFSGLVRPNLRLPDQGWDATRPQHFALLLLLLCYPTPEYLTDI
jgi:hypothetical protein